jgi:hypothetical protein
VVVDCSSDAVSIVIKSLAILTVELNSFEIKTAFHSVDTTLFVYNFRLLTMTTYMFRPFIYFYQ